MCLVQSGLEVCVPRKPALSTDAVSVNIKIYLLKPWNEAEMKIKARLIKKKQLAK